MFTLISRLFFLSTNVAGTLTLFDRFCGVRQGGGCTVLGTKQARIRGVDRVLPPNSLT